MTNVIEPQVAQFDIGDLLSSKRQQKRESRADVARATRLPEVTIERLETNDFGSIGPLVYVRGYLGLYAKHLGLNAAYVIEQYNLQHPAEEIALRPSVATSLSDETRQQTKRHSKTVSFLTAGLVVGGLAYGYLQSEALLLKKMSATPSGGTNVATIDPSSANVSAVLDRVEAAENLANDVLSGDTINQPTALVNDFELDLATSPVARAAEREAANAVAAGLATGLASANPALTPAPLIEETPAATPETETPAEPVKKATARLRLSFKGECWVKLTDGKGKTLIGRVYKKGQHLDVTAARPIKLVVGSPKAVSAASIDNQATSLTNYQISKLRFKIPK